MDLDTFKKIQLDSQIKSHHNENMVLALWLYALITPCAWAQQDAYVPSIQNGKTLYQKHCVACHGSRGDGETVVGATLKKPPRSFADPKVQETLTPQVAFETMEEGRVDSGMPAFANLTSEEKWDIAAYLFTFRTDLEHPEDPRPDLLWEESKYLSDLEITNLFRKRGVPEESISKELSVIRLFPQ